jgi:isopenicillin N synthase-like dioxygenase
MNVISQSAASRAARDVPRRALPVVDVGAVVAGERGAAAALADAWRTIWETIGFMCVVNHGVPAEQVAGMFAAAKAFHDQPEAVKQTVALNTDQRGYMGIRGADLAKGEIAENRKPSISQAMFTATEYPPDDPYVTAGTQFYGPNLWLPEETVPGFRTTTLAYMDAVTVLGKKLLPIWALALALPEDYFAPAFVDNYTYFRIAKYPPLPQHDERELGIHAHRDTGFMTFLPPANEEGLQILDEDGQWFWPELPADAMVVNLGQFASRWTNDRFRATTHRVVPPLKRDRYALPCFVNPNFEVRNAPLASCSGPGNPHRYPVQTYREWFGWYMSQTFGIYDKAKTAAE